MTDPITVEITEVAYGGRAVARHEGRVLFLYGALPGEIVRAEVLREHKTYAEARVLEILQASPARGAPACPLAATPGTRPVTAVCPGCRYQHATYREELRLKEEQLRSLLAAQAGVAAELVAPPVPSPLELGYRNKIVLHAQAGDGRTALGYVSDDNRTVVDVPACPLAMPALNAVLARTRGEPGFLEGLRDGASVTFRHTARDGALCWRSRAAANDTWLVEVSAVGALSVPRNSFYQVNPMVGDLLMGRVAREVRDRAPDRVLDLFCGVGVFALAAAAAGAPEVVGSDVDAEAMKAAAFNAKRLGAERIRWVEAAADGALRELGAWLRGPRALLVLDPPRGGLGPKLVRRLAQHPPGTVLYISCAPDTLARDVAWLREAGYRVQRSGVYDMFPRTGHFESVTVLERETETSAASGLPTGP
jgi:23S rRNA (uracil1939-C5)-methyltransferase